MDRIVEMAMVKLMPDGTVIKKPEEPGREHRILINPEMPIPVESSLVHGVYDEDVKDAPTFGRVAPGLLKWLHGCDLGGFNSNRFDVPMLAEEFLRVGIDFGLEGRNLIDVQNVFHRMEQRTLRAAFKFYCDKDLEGAHEALPTLATVSVPPQLDRYKDKTVLDSRGETVGGSFRHGRTRSVLQNAQQCRLDGTVGVRRRRACGVQFGNTGKRVKKVLDRDPGYFGWMMQGDFPRYTKRILQKVKDGEL